MIRKLVTVLLVYVVLVACVGDLCDPGYSQTYAPDGRVICQEDK